MSKTEKIIDLMAGVVGGNEPLKCPKCDAEFHIAMEAAWKPHLMTLEYGLAEGHKMQVEEFTSSIAALAKALKAIGREMGAKVQVLIHELKTTERSVSITVAVVLLNEKRGVPA